MAEASDIRSILLQNLLDAGCGPDTISQCMDLVEKRKQSDLLRVLTGHRRELLNLVHQNEKRIDCLDYLLYQIEKQNI